GSAPPAPSSEAAPWSRLQPRRPGCFRASRRRWRWSQPESSGSGLLWPATTRSSAARPAATSKPASATDDLTPSPRWPGSIREWLPAKGSAQNVAMLGEDRRQEERRQGERRQGERRVAANPPRAERRTERRRQGERRQGDRRKG